VVTSNENATGPSNYRKCEEFDSAIISFTTRLCCMDLTKLPK
jgi:hypothetical protein